MSKPSKRVQQWLMSNGFKQAESPGTTMWQWTRKVPIWEKGSAINASYIQVTYFPEFRGHRGDPYGVTKPASWQVQASVNSQKFMGPDEDRLISALERALVWQDSPIPFTDEEREVDRDGEESAAESRRRRGFEGYGALDSQMPEVEFNWWIEPENDIEPEDSFQFEEDIRHVRAEIRDGVESAWCNATVTAECYVEGPSGVFPIEFRGNDHVGGMSWASERALWKDNLKDMLSNAFDDLINEIRYAAAGRDGRVGRTKPSAYLVYSQDDRQQLMVVIDYLLENQDLIIAKTLKGARL